MSIWTWPASLPSPTMFILPGKKGSSHLGRRLLKFLADQPFLLFRINGDANDLPWEYTVDQYPSIMYFPAVK